MAKEKTKTIAEWMNWLGRLLRRKRVTAQEVSLLEELERVIEEHPDEPLLEKWLGFVYIMMGKEKDAERVLSRLVRVFPYDVEIQNALAYLFLKRGDTEGAVTHILDALYMEEGHPLLKRNLDLLRSLSDLEAWLATHTWTDFVFFVPPKSPWWEMGWGEIFGHPLFRWGMIGGLVVLMGGVVFFLYPTLINVAQKYQQMRYRQIGSVVDQYSIQDIEKLVEERQKYTIKLTEEEIGKKFEMIKDLLYEGKRNQALLLINELLNSNASEQVKEHVRIFESFVPLPDPRKIDYNPSCQDVLRTPFLYKDVYVSWVGTVANLFFNQRKETSFDLLINFVDEATVEGMATIKMEGFQSDLRNGRKVRVFGRIAGIQVDNKIVLLDPQIQYLDR
ncbi:MAG: tetratricopeptide repeat protein [Brevinematales bacterium]|nr:tetratricopeptide repeat protein [Brevinematales bacterium]